jgi:hypothetical protein
MPQHVNQQYPGDDELSGFQAYIKMKYSPEYQNMKMREAYERKTNPDAVYYGNDPASGMTDAQYIQNIAKPKYLPEAQPNFKTNKINLDSLKNLRLNVNDAQMRGSMDNTGNIQNQGRFNLLLNPNNSLFPAIEGGINYKDKIKATINSITGGLLPKGLRIKGNGFEYKNNDAKYGLTGGSGGFKAMYTDKF